MAKIIVVTSGKGGVGKTTTSASFASALALRGSKTAVIDFDVGLRNLDLIMGCERRVVYDLINVIQGEANLNQALIKDKKCENLFILPASQTRDKDALTMEGVEKVINDLIAMDFEYIVCDSPAGIESGGAAWVPFLGGRAACDALRRRGADRDEPGSVVGARLRPHSRHPVVEDQARDRRQGADQGESADHAL